MAGDVRVEDAPDARLIDSTDARSRHARRECGSDLRPYKSTEPTASAVTTATRVVTATRFPSEC
jgi:hypothetical protein